MTDALRALVEQWREQALVVRRDRDVECVKGTPEYDFGTIAAESVEACADALEAALAHPSTGCISCGEAHDGGYEVEDGPGPFCAECWRLLEAEFQKPAALAHPTIAKCEGCGEWVQPNKPDSTCIAAHPCLERGAGATVTQPVRQKVARRK